MALLEEAIWSRLTGFAGVSAIVAKRVYPTIAPQNSTHPLIVYQKISKFTGLAMGGPTGIADARIQTDSYAMSASAAAALAEQVRLALSGLAAETIANVTIDYVWSENDTVLYEDETKLHRVMQEYMISYREAQP